MSSRAWRFVRRFPYSIVNLGSPFYDPTTATATPAPPSHGSDIDLDNPHLNGASTDGPPHGHTAAFSRQWGDGRRHGRGRLQWYILFLCATIAIMTEFGEFLSAAPQTEVFLQIACNTHYTSIGDTAFQDTAGQKCRVEPVQSELALVDGWKETFDQLPGIVLAIPYGIMADRVGRKRILLLGQFGVLMSEIFVRLFCWYSNLFSLRWVWVASFWRIIGGGNQVHNAMVFTAIADTHDEKDRADAFYKLLAAILVSEIIATPLSAWLMNKSSWIPMLLTPVILFATLLLVLFFLPETLQESRKTSKSSEIPKGSGAPLPGAPQDLNFDTVGSSSRAALEFLFARRNVTYLLFGFFAATVGRKCMVLLLQFVYKKFGWTLAQASFLISLRGTVNLFLNLAILPLLTWILMSPRFAFRLGVSPKDLALSKLSACLLTLGCAILALCSSITTLVLGVCVFALGNSFFLTARSLITSLVPSTHVGVLYTAIGMVSGVGVLIAGPVLAQAFNFGLKIGDAWLGLPYALSAALFGTVALAVWRVRLPPEMGSDAEVGGVEDEEEGVALMERVGA